MPVPPLLFVAFVVLLVTSPLFAIEPNLAGRTERPLRYRPEGTNFVIENGAEFFNRPLYGGNTAFRVDAGDKPEFSLFLPGRGGNLRLGAKRGDASKWLDDAEKIVSRYRHGMMVYEIEDPILHGKITVTVVATSSVEGLVVQVSGISDGDAELIFAYGGANGDRGSRNGDIGAEREPVSRFFQLRPEYCRDNAFQIDGSNFVMQARAARIAGVMPQDATLSICDASKWGSINELLASAGKPTQTPVVVARVAAKQSIHCALQRLGDATAQALQPADLSAEFDRSQKHFDEMAQRVQIETPDPYINSAAAALVVAADAVWDEPTSAFMHGAVAWRTKLLGWRGAYSGDALGWHDRTRRHLDNWFGRQNDNPVDPNIHGADPDSNLARSERMLHSNGDLTNSHYDMNLPAIDILFRHLLWTGDREYMKQVWPVIQRHLAWERRLFRREFGPEKLPLYEGYACIWASDDLQYSGGGATHATAYNLWHNRMAARVAQMLGEDPAPYRTEAELIARAMKSQLWLKDGWYAECKDLLGLQLVHPSAALWTYYHTIDSQAADPFEAWQMGRFVDTQMAHIPVTKDCGTLATTTWMPYTWSINNVVMAETTHTSLADWQAGRIDQAFAAFKGAILDSMFQGLCPGNVGMCTGNDVYRRESQRDFADGVGATSRALVEGLFGITPDALAGELFVRPGFPHDWDHASIRHPDFTSAFSRKGDIETYSVESRFALPMGLRLRCAARGVGAPDITVNGRPAEWRNIDDAIARPQIEISSGPARRWEVVIKWNGDVPLEMPAESMIASGGRIERTTRPALLLEVFDPQAVLGDVQKTKDTLKATAVGAIGHRSVFVRVQQGEMKWWMPIALEIAPPQKMIQASIQDAGHLRFVARDNTTGESRPIVLDSGGFLPGTNRVRADVETGRAVEGTVVNWNIVAPESTRWETLDLKSIFNDSVTQIFRNDYVSPRSPYCSLAIPKNGLGAWASNKKTAQIDDSGLRELAGKFRLPQGVPFDFPREGKNSIFVSQWDNYPREVSAPLNGKASHVYLLMAGSTNPMQSRTDNGEVVVTYADGTSERLPLRNPETWWPIEQDYFIDDYGFANSSPLPPRVDLKTGLVRTLNSADFKGKGAIIPGGAATVLDLALDVNRELKSITVRALANEVVIGLMSVTLVRP